MFVLKSLNKFLCKSESIMVAHRNAEELSETTVVIPKNFKEFTWDIENIMVLTRNSKDVLNNLKYNRFFLYNGSPNEFKRTFQLTEHLMIFRRNYIGFICKIENIMILSRNF